MKSKHRPVMLSSAPRSWSSRLGKGVGWKRLSLRLIAACLLSSLVSLEASAADLSYGQPGPFTVSNRTLSNIARTAGGSGTFDALVYYPSTTSASGGPLNLSGGPYPVVSFAHGYTTNTATNHPVNLARLASYGYIVIAPRSYESVLDVFQTEALGHDLASAYNYLASQNSNSSSFLYQGVQTNGFSAAGHSMGGHAAISEASQNSAVKTIVTWAAQNMAIPVVAQDQIRNVHVPVQMIAGTNDTTVSASTTSAIYNNGNPPIILNNLVGGTHLGFYDSGPQWQLDYTRSLTVQWLNLYSKGDQSGWRQLWGPEAALDSQINYSVNSGIRVTAPNGSAKTGDLGTTVTYTVRVRNDGDYATSYSLFIEDNNWNTTLSTLQTPVLQPGTNTNFQVTVHLPNGVGTDKVLVSARNNTDGGTRGWIYLQTTAIPEPGTLVLLSLGLAILAWRVRRAA
jgi:dienelactone hydrolase